MDSVLLPQRVSELRGKLRRIVDEAIEDFNQRELFLIVNGLSERCICAKFASYIEKVMSNTNVTEFIQYVIDLKSYNVDVEYNRTGDMECDQDGCYIKKLPNEKDIEKMIVVDLIIHIRGENQYGSNLICIEMKKKNRSIDSDINRLKKLTDEKYGYDYLAGYMILIEANKKNDQYCLSIDSEYPQN